jgi:hypothetical protein
MACTSGTSSVCLVSLVCLVCLVEPDRPNRPDKQNEQDRLASFWGSLLGFGFAVVKMPMLPVKPGMA